MFQAIAPNAFFVFAGTFPTNNAVANLLLGAPVTFYQGLGDFSRGHARVGRSARYAQDEWRVGTAADAELRPPLRADQPVHRGRGPAERLHARRAVDGQARRARAACVFPGDAGHRPRASRRAPTPSCRASASRGIRPARASGRCARATASSTTSSRTAPARPRRCRSARSRGRSSTSSAAPA